MIKTKFVTIHQINLALESTKKFSHCLTIKFLYTMFVPFTQSDRLVSLKH